LRPFRATQIQSDPSIDPQRGAGRSLARRRHEAGPVQTEAAHDEPDEGIELDTGLAGLESDDRVWRDAGGGRERFQADALTLAFFAQARGDASSDGPHRPPRVEVLASEQRSSLERLDHRRPGRLIAGAERSAFRGRTNDDMVASGEAGVLDQLH
jgi:hypothetical protein